MKQDRVELLHVRVPSVVGGEAIFNRTVDENVPAAERKQLVAEHRVPEQDLLGPVAEPLASGRELPEQQDVADPAVEVERQQVQGADGGRENDQARLAEDRRFHIGTRRVPASIPIPALHSLSLLESMRFRFHQVAQEASSLLTQSLPYSTRYYFGSLVTFLTLLYPRVGLSDRRNITLICFGKQKSEGLESFCGFLFCVPVKTGSDTFSSLVE